MQQWELTLYLYVLRDTCLNHVAKAGNPDPNGRRKLPWEATILHRKYFSCSIQLLPDMYFAINTFHLQ